MHLPKHTEAWHCQPSTLLLSILTVSVRRWYLDVVKQAELADYGPVRGTMVIRPYG